MLFDVIPTHSSLPAKECFSTAAQQKDYGGNVEAEHTLLAILL